MLLSRTKVGVIFLTIVVMVSFSGAVQYGSLSGRGVDQIDDVEDTTVRSRDALFDSKEEGVDESRNDFFGNSFTNTFEYTGGQQSWTAPKGVSTVTIECWGAEGRANGHNTASGGLGGYAKGNLSVTTGETLYIYVGGGGGVGPSAGWNGGGPGGVSGDNAYADGGGGGGASDVRIGGTALNDRKIVAGGGGGAGGDRIDGYSRGAGGGGGGGYYGGGGGGAGEGDGGTGGTQTSGGSGGSGTYDENGGDGSLGSGGYGGDAASGTQAETNYGPDGAAGGGTSGDNGTNGVNYCGGSGGGGSGYIGGVSDGSMSNGVRSGNGLVEITYTQPSPETKPATNVTSTSAVLRGDLTGLAESESANVSFSYREVGGSWNETKNKTMTDSGEFNETVTGLQSLTKYEFKAVADVNGTEYEGDVLIFLTGEISNTIQLQEEWSVYNQAENVSTDGDDLSLGEQYNTINAGDYCDVGGGDTSDGQYITNVQFNGIDRDSGNDGGYADHTDNMSDPVELGETYEISVTMTTASWNGYASVVFDWSGDENLTNEDVIEIGGGSSDPQTATTDITVPTDAASGESIIMRVMQEEDSYHTDPCGNQSYGETEDYTVAVEGYVEEGYRISKPLSLEGLKNAGESIIEWNSTEPTDTNVKVYTAVTDNDTTIPSTWQEATNGRSIPGTTRGENLTGQYLWTKQVLTTTNSTKTPRLHDLSEAIGLANYNLTIEGAEGGEVTEPGEATFEYTAGEEVELKAEADSGYYFVEWTGETDNISDIQSNETTVEIWGNYTIQPKFEEYVYLTIDGIEGNGSVEVDGTEVDSNDLPYQERYEQGSRVELKALPDENWTFVNWTGDVPSGEEENETVNITMDGDRTLQANFAPLEYNLDISIEGEGSTEPSEGTHTYEEGEEVTITAIPAEGWNFTEWTGDYEGSEENITIKMDDNKAVTAHFEQEVVEYDLTINIDGEGSTEPSEGNHTYEEGENVTVIATPAEGWNFTEWTGDYGGSEENITIKMDEDKSITAHFEQDVVEYDLIIDIEGEGSTEPSEGTHTYEEGEEVTITATPEEGWNFVEWTGDIESTEEEITVKMDDDYTITAHFDEKSLWVEVVSPEEDEMFNKSEIEVEWDSRNADNHEIRLDKADWIDVGDETAYVFEELEDGEHLIEVRVTGLDETIQDEVSVVVDTVPPEIELTSPEDGESIGERDVSIEWEGSDETSGIIGYGVRLDGDKWIDVGEETNYTFESLEEGDYTVEVRTEDEVGNEVVKSLTFTVDVTSPELNIIAPKYDENIKGKDVSVEWEGSDYITVITGYEIRLNDEEWIEVGEETSYTFEELEEGEYTVEVKARDAAGNEEIETVNFTVESEDGSGFFALSNYWWVFLLILLILIPILFFWERRKEGEVEEETMPERGELEKAESGYVEESLEDEMMGKERKPPPMVEKPVPEEAPVEETQKEPVSEGTEEESIEEPSEVEVEEDLSDEEEAGREKEQIDVFPVASQRENAAIEDEIFYECDECGSLITLDEDECPYCGTPIDKGEKKSRRRRG